MSCADKWEFADPLALITGQQDASDATMETLKAIEHSISKSTQILTDVCAYAGTGNVLKIQSLLHHCNDHLDPEKESDLHQAIATIGIAMIAMGEDVGAEMSLRQYDHLVGVFAPLRVLVLTESLSFRCIMENRSSGGQCLWV